MASGSLPLLRRLAGVASVGFLSYFAEYAAFIVVLAWISDKLTVTFGTGTAGYALVGTISGVYLVLSGLIAIPMGHLADRFGRRAMAAAGCLLGSLGLVSLTLMDTLGTAGEFLAGVLVALTLLGLGHGTYTASTLAYVGDMASVEDVGKSYGLIEDVEFAAYTFGPGFGGVVAVALGRESSFIFAGFLMIVATAISLLAMRGRGRRTLAPAAEEMGITGGSASGGHGPATDVGWKQFARLMKDSTIGVTLLSTLVLSLAFTAFFLYVSIYAQNLSAVPLVRAVGAASGTIMAVASIVALVPFGHMEDRTGRRMPFLVIGFFGAAASLVFVFSSPTIFAFLSAALVFGVSLSLGRVSQYVILSEKSSEDDRAAVMGTNHAVEHAGYGIGALVGGVLIGILGASTAFRYVGAVLLLFGLLFFLFATRKQIR